MRIMKEKKRGLFLCLILMMSSFFAAFFISRVRLWDNSRMITPPLDSWESRYLIYDDGWHIDDRIYRENGLGDEPETEIIYGPFIHLDKGGYYALIDYETSSDQFIRIYGFENEDKIKVDESTILTTESGQKCYRFDITENIDNFEIRVVYSGEGFLSINNIRVFDETWGMYYHIRNLAIVSGIVFFILFMIIFNSGLYKVSEGRELWIDLARGIGIVLVFLGHLTADIPRWPIYGFHMPLFFILSGYLYRDEKISKYCVKLIRRYIIPYLCFCFANSLLRIPYMMTGDYTLSGIKNKLILYWIGSLKGSWREMPNCMPLWFLPALSVSLLLFRIIRLIPIKTIRVIIYAICAVFGYNWNSLAETLRMQQELPWGLHTVFTVIVFISIGCVLKQFVAGSRNIYENHTKTKRRIVAAMAMVSGFICIIVNHRLFSDVDIYYNSYGNFFLAYAGAILTSVSLILFCREICNRLNGSNILVVIGYNSIFFFAFDFWGKNVALNYPCLVDHESWIAVFCLKFIFVSLLFVLWKNIKHYILKMTDKTFRSKRQTR